MLVESCRWVLLHSGASSRSSCGTHSSRVLLTLAEKRNLLLLLIAQIFLILVVREA